MTGVILIAGTFAAFILPPTIGRCAERRDRPNIVFILADDLGYGDLGCYGQKRIKTPRIDRMAAEGIRFSDCYAGSTVCAPSRCVLMTGLHSGHSRIRGNGEVPLAADDLTVAKTLREAGYRTGLIGKWGLGEEDSSGIPNRQGFDEYFGYLNQVHAHNHYPAFLWRNQKKVSLGNLVTPRGSALGGVATRRVEYSSDRFTSEALDFLDRHKDGPFFLYLAYTIPHANNEAGNRGMEVPSLAPYEKESWPEPQKGHAAMITRLDGYVGRVLAKLDELRIADRTIVFFTSDNGPHKEGGADPEFFHSSGHLRGYKRSLHDGGIRVPMIVRWPGKIRSGRTSDLPWAFWDFLPRRPNWPPPHRSGRPTVSRSRQPYWTKPGRNSTISFIGSFTKGLLRGRRCGWAPGRLFALAPVPRWNSTTCEATRANGATWRRSTRT